MSDNTVTFRLPEDSMRELNRLCAAQGKSRGLLAKEMVLAALAGFSRFDDLDVRLTTIDRRLESLMGAVHRRQTGDDSMNELRSVMATASYLALVRFGRLSEEEAAQWVQDAFGVREEGP